MKTTVLLHADEIARVLDRLACQIMERHGDCEQTVLLGIQRRGVDLAVRLGKALEDKLGRKLPFGTLDINLYRDDWTTMHARPTIGESNITTPLDNKNVILVDDVLFTGRTVRAALDALMDIGRPACVQLAVLVDRGHRQLPIRADYVGKNVPSSATTWAARSTRPALKRSMSLWKNATAGTKSSSKAPTPNGTRPGGQAWSLHAPVPAFA